jgi:hypothetical protein
VHDSYDPHAIQLVKANDGIRKFASQSTLGWWTDAKETVRLAANFPDDSFDFVSEAASECRCDGGVVSDSLGVFFTRFGMKDVRLHRPRILRMRAETSSAGIP